MRHTIDISVQVCMFVSLLFTTKCRNSAGFNVICKVTSLRLDRVMTSQAYLSDCCQDRQHFAGNRVWDENHCFAARHVTKKRKTHSATFTCILVKL